MWQIGDIAIYLMPWSLALCGLAMAALAYATFTVRQRLWRLPGILAAALAPLLMAATYTGLPIALTNAQMQFYPSWQWFAVLRLGVNAVGDAPPQWFVPSGTACSISGGDVGSEVPTKDGGCFNADFISTTVDLREWGAVGNGSTNDSSAAQAAITAMANGGTIALGPRVYCVNALTIPAGATEKIVGSGSNYYFPNGVISGFNQCSTNQTLITVAGETTGTGAQGVVLEDFSIDAAAAGTDTSGIAILTKGANALVKNVTILNPFTGVQDIGVTDRFEGVTIQQKLANTSSGCGGFFIGNDSQQAQDTRIINSTVSANTNCSWGIFISNLGGGFISGNDLIGMQFGTEINPPNGAAVFGTHFVATVMGDTTSNTGFVVSHATSSSILDIICDACYVGRGPTTNTPAVDLENPAGTGTASGITFIGLRTTLSGGDIVKIGAIRGVSIRNSMLCGANTSNSSNVYAIEIANANDVSIQDNRIGENCAGQVGNDVTAQIGINGTNVTGPLNISGNDLNGASPPIGLISALPENLGGIIIKNNANVDSAFPTVASAASITLPVNPQAFLSGTTQISTMLGGWVGRTVQLIPTDASSITTGGNICDSMTFAGNQLHTAIWNGACWYVN